MSITINIKGGPPKINIIKDEEQELEQINLMADQIVEKLMNHPEAGEKVKEIGKDQLKEMAKEILQENIKKREQEQIDDALEMSEKLSEALITGLVKGVTKIAKEL